MKNYDPLYDFNIVLQKIKEKNNPDALLIAGDMFDFKKTAAHISGTTKVKDL